MPVHIHILQAVSPLCYFIDMYQHIFVKHHILCSQTGLVYIAYSYYVGKVSPFMRDLAASGSSKTLPRYSY